MDQSFGMGCKLTFLPRPSGIDGQFLYRSRIDFDSLGLTNKIEIMFDRGREYPVYGLGLSKERFKCSKGKKCTFWFNNFFSLICSSMPSNCVKSNSRYDPA